MSQRHPRGLVSKEIGLWYKEQAQKKKKEEICDEITLPEDVIQKLLELINSTEKNSHVDKLDKEFEHFFNTTINTTFENYLEILSMNSILEPESQLTSQDLKYDISSNRMSQVDTLSDYNKFINKPAETELYKNRQLPTPNYEADIVTKTDENSIAGASYKMLNVLPNYNFNVRTLNQKLVLDDNTRNNSYVVSSKKEDRSKSKNNEVYFPSENESACTSENFSISNSSSIENFNLSCNNSLQKNNILPVFEHRYEILNALNDNNVVLISGDTGCGKTTQIPQFILDSFLKLNNENKFCNIICTQPRRISAITIAERVAMERNEKLGVNIGYSVRLEKCLPKSKNCSITYCTTGVLLHKLERNPLLMNVSHIIIDEIHERNIESDLIIGFVEKICKYNENLKVILMSATFGTEEFAKHFNKCAIIYIKGTLFPITNKYLEDILEETQFFDFKSSRKPVQHKNYHRNRINKLAEQATINSFKELIEPFARSLIGSYSSRVIQSIQNIESENLNLELILKLIQSINQNQPDGAILVFLPGYDKISKLFDLLKNTREYKQGLFIIYTLHSMMPTAIQKGVFVRPCNGFRKIVLSTNIAETSITIEDIVYVINSGRQKIKNYDMEHNYETLFENWVTLAHSKQRQGRAGRCQPGICYHLYTRAREYMLDEYAIPEIQRSRLEPVILELKMMKIQNINEFFLGLISPPHGKTIENGIKLLHRINALNENETLTPLGLHLARLPLDPQIGKMLLISAIFKCIDPITSIAAVLSFRDPFYIEIGREKELRQIKNKFANFSGSDHLMYANILNQFKIAKEKNYERSFCNANFLVHSTANQLIHLKEQLFENLQSAGFISKNINNYESMNINSNNIKLLRAIITAGLYPYVGYIQKIRTIKNHVAKVVNIVTPDDGQRVEIHPSSVNYAASNFDTKYLMYFSKQKTNSLCIYDTTTVHPISLALFGDQFTTGNLENGTLFISIAGQFRFKVNEPVKNLIIELRHKFDTFLKKLALNPSLIDLEFNTDKNLIDALILILSYEQCDD